jgi:phosphatidate cytidylyltransferase
MTEKNRNLLVRVASAAVLSPLLVLVILCGRPEPMALLIHLAVLVGMAEYFWIVLRDDPVWMRLCGLVLGLMISVTIYWWPRPEGVLAALLISTLGVTIIHLLRFGEIQTATARTALMVFGLLYLPLLLTPIALLKRQPEGSDWIFLLLTLTWFSDTGAYFTGRAFGKHKLYPAISPGKTVEGALGGLLFSFGAAVLAKQWYMPQLSWVDTVAITLPGGALAQCGDLVESMIKRGYGVKDSGRIIPGHGGLLDRIDALLFSAPYVYLYVTFFFHGPNG